MSGSTALHSVVLLCHADDPVDTQGVAAWLAASFRLVGIIELDERPGALLRKVRREYRRVGGLRLLDVLAFRLLYRCTQAATDRAWVRHKVQELRQRYPAVLEDIPKLRTNDPNGAAVREFVSTLHPDFMLARCKHILDAAVFRLPRLGTFVLHPGICPRYRNAHGCFWALVSRDLDAVGMTLLQVDAGIDTGPVYLQASYPFDEAGESHVVIQHRVVLDNLDAIGTVLQAIGSGAARPLGLPPQRSRNWGQPWLSAWLHWQRNIPRAGARA